MRLISKLMLMPALSLFLMVPILSGAPAYVTGNVNACSATSCAVSLTGTNAGDLIVVGLFVLDSTSVSSVTDTQGNTYTLIGSPQTWSPHNFVERLYYAKNIKGGADTTTVVLSGSKYMEVRLYDYSGLNTSSPLDTSATPQTGSSVTGTSGSLTTGNANDLLFGFFHSDNSVTNTPGSGFTGRTFAGDGYPLAEDEYVTSINLYSATMNFSGSADYVGFFVAFKAASSTSGTPPAPGTPTYTNISTTSLTVNWTASTGATSYIVYRSPSSNGTYSQVGTSSTTSYGDTGLTPNTPYWYEVAGTNANGTGPQSASSSVTTTSLSGAPAYVTGNVNACSATSCAVSLTGTNAGDLIVVGLFVLDSTSVSSVTDTQGNTYTLIGSPQTWSLHNFVERLYYAKNIKGGADTTTVVLSGSKYMEVRLYDYSGLNTSSPLDTSATPQTGSSVTGTSGSLTTGNANDLLFGFFHSDNSVTNTPGSGFTGRTFAGDGYPLAEDEYVTSINLYSATMNFSGSADYVGFFVAFKAASSTSGTPPAPGTPTYTNISTTSLTVNWTASTGATSYIVYRSPSSNGTYSQVGTSSTTSYGDTGLTPNTPYWYEVAGTNANGTGPQSASSSVTTTSLSGAPAYVTGNVNACSATSCAVSLTGTNAGDLIVVGLFVLDSTSVSSVTDTQGNTYTLIGSPQTWSLHNFVERLYYAKNIKGGADTTTVVLSGSKYMEVRLYDYSGLNTSSPLDTSATPQTGSSVTGTSGSLTTGNANDLLFGFFHSDNSVTNTPGSGFTGRTFAGDGYPLAEDEYVTSINLYSATMNFSGSADYVGFFVAFKAASSGGMGPTISGVSLSPLTATSATVNWTTNLSASSRVDFGITAAYGSYVTDPTLVTSHSETLSSLSCGTTYHYRITSADSAGSSSTADTTFTTSACVMISGVSVSAVTTTTAAVNWTTNVGASSLVNYGTTAAYGSNVSDPTLVTSHSLTLNSLRCNTTYHYQITSAVGPGNSASTIDATFTTSACGGPVSDDFHTSVLNPMWAFYAQCCGYVKMTGTDALLVVPSVTSHDIYNVNQGVGLLQNIANVDFQVEVKFDSIVTQGDQVEGILVQQDAQDFIWFAVYYDGTTPRVYSAVTIGGTPSQPYNTPITIPAGTTSFWMRVNRSGTTWTQSWSVDGTNYNSNTFSQALVVSSIGPAGGNDNDPSNDPAPSFTAAVDYFFNTASPISPTDGGLPQPPNEPVFSVWYGDNQTFGQLGIPQRWVNILGNVSAPSGIASASYTLNGGAPQFLRVGPNPTRLADTGDFNVDIDHAILNPGANTVVITATDNLNNTTTHTVTVNWENTGQVWPLPYSIDWSTVTNISDVAQVVDGLWAIQPDGTVRTVQTGYDRLIALGDETWTDYQVTAEITFNSFDCYDFGAGVFVGWTGHTYDPTVIGILNPDQPLDGHPFFGVGEYSTAGGPPSNARLDIYANSPNFHETTLIADTSGLKLSIGVKYDFKFAVQRNPDNTSSLYSFKVWPASTAEPANWYLQANGDASTGSILLGTFRTDASFGNITVVPLP